MTESDHMTEAELIVFLETLAEYIELKAATGNDAAEIIRAKTEALKKKPLSKNELPGTTNHRELTASQSEAVESLPS